MPLERGRVGELKQADWALKGLGQFIASQIRLHNCGCEGGGPVILAASSLLGCCEPDTMSVGADLSALCKAGKHLQVIAKPFLFIITAQGAKHLQRLSQSEADFSDAVKAGKHLQIVADTRQSWTTIS